MPHAQPLYAHAGQPPTPLDDELFCSGRHFSVSSADDGSPWGTGVSLLTAQPIEEQFGVDARGFVSRHLTSLHILRCCQDIRVLNNPRYLDRPCHITRCRSKGWDVETASLLPREQTRLERNWFWSRSHAGLDACRDSIFPYPVQI
jgi:hypothetical protein